jgi:hypothetical protein
MQTKILLKNQKTRPSCFKVILIKSSLGIKAISLALPSFVFISTIFLPSPPTAALQGGSHGDSAACTYGGAFVAEGLRRPVK